MDEKMNVFFVVVSAILLSGAIYGQEPLIVTRGNPFTVTQGYVVQVGKRVVKPASSRHRSLACELSRCGCGCLASGRCLCHTGNWDKSAKDGTYDGWHYFRNRQGEEIAAWHEESDSYWKIGPYGTWHEWIDDPKEDGQTAAPFDITSGEQASAAADVDDETTGPWLLASEQRYLRGLMPDGVSVPKTLRFYRLPQVYQSLYTMNGGRPYRDVLPAIDEDPWRVSGGMHHVARDGWRNATGLALPQGSAIDVWEEWIDVGAFGPVPKVRWRFPEGTQAYDVLIKVDGDGAEHVFEVRVHEKQAQGWDGGRTYRPQSEVIGTSQGWTWGFPRHGLEADSTVFAGVFSDRPLFVESKRIVADDGAFVPRGYLGAGLRCNQCHNRVGELTGYARGRRGDDGRFSWHPFGVDGKVDARWPLAVRR